MIPCVRVSLCACLAVCSEVVRLVQAFGDKSPPFYVSVTSVGYDNIHAITNNTLHVTVL